MKSLSKASIISFFLIASLSGCVPVLIGSWAYSGSQSDATKQKWLEDYNRTNLEREKAGLAPLDYCTEARRYDAKMADADPTCTKSTKIAENQ